jgi:anti-sigma B factor antagonist
MLADQGATLMDITSRTENGVMIFVLEGRIDSAGANQLDDELQRALADGQYKMVLDMAGVTYINSAGLRTLADVLTQSRAQAGDLRLVALSPKVERVFKIIGFDRFFASYATVNDALAGL